MNIIEKARNKSVKDLNGDSIYDEKIHLPVPTIDYLKGETGMDLIMILESESSAKSYAKLATRDCFKYISLLNLEGDSRIIEYLIAKDATWRNSFCLFVVDYISGDINGSNYSEMTGNTIHPQIERSIKSSGFQKRFSFRLSNELYRTDY